MLGDSRFLRKSSRSRSMAESKTAAEKWGEATGKAAFNILKIVVILYFVILLVFKGAWDLLVPTLFPGAVQQGLVAETISGWTAFYLAGAVSLLAAFVRWGGGSWLGDLEGADQRVLAGL